MTPRVQKQRRSDPSVEWAPVAASVLWRGDRRLESETYLTGGHAVRLAIEDGDAGFATLDQLANVWQPGRLKGISVAPEHGLAFLTATQVFDIRPAPRKWLAPGRTDDLKRRFLEPGWILVTCSGNVGDAIISYGPHIGVIVSHDLLRVQVKDQKHFGYLYAFLRSQFGRAMARSSQYGSIIKHLEPEHLQALPVPAPTDAICEQLSVKVQQVMQHREKAFDLTSEAESLYSSNVGDVQEGDEEAPYTTRADDLFGHRRRLDGYFHNPRAKNIVAALRATGKPIEPLHGLTDRIFTTNRFKHVYADAGLAYLDSEDLFKLNPEITKFIPPGAKKDAQKYFVRKDWLLAACSGQIYGLNGSVVLATEWHEGKVVSNHVLRIVPRGDLIRPGYLQMVLGHPTLGRPMMIRMSFGTEIPEIAAEDVEDFPVIRLGDSIETEIANHVARAAALRLQANEMENEAVHAVEAFLTDLLPSLGHTSSLGN